MNNLVRWNGAGMIPAPLLHWMMDPWTSALGASWPQVHVYENDDAITLTADVPGLGDDDLDVTVAGRMLTIEGRDRRHGMTRQFRRQIQLADGYDLERIEAGLERGVLAVRVPKTDAIKPRRIKLMDRVKNLLGKGEG